MDRLSQSLMNATVDLNPHQVEAALFALRSPFSCGSMLADEVGLGKTIEAGLVLSQLWAENKRKIIIVLPASLRKQWQIELEEKFNLPSIIIESKAYRQLKTKGHFNPFDQKRIVLVSYNFSSRYAEDVKAVKWDLVVFDEAHRLRNSYRESNKTGQKLRWAFENSKKLLLTATPFQNSLSELYGLCSLIDEHFFGDYPTFRTMYGTADGDLYDLKNRIRSLCKRTLRKDVLEFVKYTDRMVETINFKPTDDEHRLYLAVTSLLQREDTYAIPNRQKHLTAVVLRKMLASSPLALAGTLKKILARLEEMKKTPEYDQTLLDFYDEDLEEELFEELELEEENLLPERTVDLEKIEDEIQEVKSYIKWAESIGTDTKSSYLTKALNIGYAHMEKMGAEKKAVIFTESRKTQQYLKTYLDSKGYEGKVITFSGSNRGQSIKAVLEWWYDKHPDKVTGTLTVDKRQAIVDYFREEGEILIATQAAGEGINLQFCSLLINYDLPWNPQRVEQRIGRVHRYGQKHDVVVINFLNSRNKTDQRVYELLRHKFNLFEGLMGASDEVIGQLQSSSAFEQRITDIYMKCRSPEEIDAAFEELQQELDSHIQEKMKKTREDVLENFDEDVHSRLKIDYDEALDKMDDINLKFWKLSKHILNKRAKFDDDSLTFKLSNPPDNVWPGKYRLNTKTDVRKQAASDVFNEKVYRVSHPLGQYCLEKGKAYESENKSVVFNLSEYPHKISSLSDLQGSSGYLILKKITIESVDVEEHLLFSARTDDGKTIPSEVAEKMFRLDGKEIDLSETESSVLGKVQKDAEIYKNSTVRNSFEEKNRFFQERREELYRWAEDVVVAAERELKTIKQELRSAEREAREATTVEEQKEAQEKIRKISRKKRKARENIFKMEDQVEEKRDKLIERLEKGLKQRVKEEELFTIGFKVI